MTDVAARRAELIGGQPFTRPERTPYLAALVDRAQLEIEAVCRRVARDATVLRDADVLLSVQAVVIPDLTIYRRATCDIPGIIVEYRAESTDRLFFGPKRLAYARALIPEVWFVDATKARVTVLRLGNNLDYPWPAESYGPGDMIESSAIESLTIPAEALLAPPRSG